MAPANMKPMTKKKSKPSRPSRVPLAKYEELEQRHMHLAYILEGYRVQNALLLESLEKQIKQTTEALDLCKKTNDDFLKVQKQNEELIDQQAMLVQGKIIELAAMRAGPKN